MKMHRTQVLRIRIAYIAMQPKLKARMKRKQIDSIEALIQNGRPCIQDNRRLSDCNSDKNTP